MKIIVSGASGLIGQPLVASLRKRGHEVVQLVRRAPRANESQWNPSAGQLDVADIAVGNNYCQVQQKAERVLVWLGNRHLRRARRRTINRAVEPWDQFLGRNLQTMGSRSKTRN